MSRLRRRRRSSSPRLAKYDYAQGGWYHLVACTADRHHSFGEVRNGIVGLSEAGCIAAWAWPRTLSAYPRAVQDAFIVMPDHVHLLLGLRARQREPDSADLTEDEGKPHPGPIQPENERSFGDGLTPHSVSSIMNHYKGRVTKTIRRYDACPGFSWQSRFYDHVLRSEEALDRHRRYVRSNPARWEQEGPPPDRLIPD